MTAFRKRFEERVRDRTAVIGIIGLGYVGIPLALRFWEVGLPVIGFDIDRTRVEQLNAGRSPIRHIPGARIAEMGASGFCATDDYSRVAEADALIVCVPTPLNAYREPDLRYVVDTLESAAPHLRPGQMLSLESTTWPGTTEEVLRPRLEGRGFRIGEDFFLVYSPEREDPGNADFSTRTIPKLVGGSTAACLEAGAVLYGAVVDAAVKVSSTRVAEMAKLLENIHRAVNIGLVNEMKVVADRMGLDIFEVIDAAATKPFGFTPYYPGPGIGGHCIPVDPFYLTWKAREYGLHTRFIELAGEVNASMPDYVVDKLVRGLNARGKSLNGSSILVLGVAYKRGVDDMRESPALEILERLRQWGAEISYSDPYVPRVAKLRHHDFDLEAVAATPEAFAAADAVVLATDHAEFDYAALLESAALIVDTRGRYRNVDAANLVRA